MSNISGHESIRMGLEFLDIGSENPDRLEALKSFAHGVNLLMTAILDNKVIEMDYMAYVLRRSAGTLENMAKILSPSSSNDVPSSQVAAGSAALATPTVKQSAHIENQLTYDYVYSDIIGLTLAKKMFYQAFNVPRMAPQLFQYMSPWKSILLFGPPGTGKTALVCAAAKESGWNHISLNPAEIFDMYVGESEKKIVGLLKKAEQLSPCIILADEIEALAQQRSEKSSSHDVKFSCQLFQSISKITCSNQIVFVGITNTPQVCDAALRRRFESRIFIPLPDVEERIKLFKKYIGVLQNNLTDEDFVTLAEMSERFSGDDIKCVVKCVYMENAHVFVNDLLKKGMAEKDICIQTNSIILTKEKIAKVLLCREPSTSLEDEIMFDDLKDEYATSSMDKYSHTGKPKKKPPSLSFKKFFKTVC